MWTLHIGKLVEAYRSSADRQAQSNWKSFQDWLPEHVSTITTKSVMEFLMHLEDVKHLNPRALLNYRSRLRLPFHLAFNIDFESEVFSLLARNQFLTNPPQRKKIPEWSVDKVLDLLSTAEFDLRGASPEHLLLKTLFLTALASGNRVSELAATSHQGLDFSDNKVALPTRPVFLFKNQSIKNPSPPAIQFPALGHNNSFCPVAALRNYVAKTSHFPHQGVLFINPTSGKPLAAGKLSY